MNKYQTLMIICAIVLTIGAFLFNAPTNMSETIGLLLVITGIYFMGYYLAKDEDEIYLRLKEMGVKA